MYILCVAVCSNSLFIYNFEKCELVLISNFDNIFTSSSINLILSFFNLSKFSLDNSYL